MSIQQIVKKAVAAAAGVRDIYSGPKESVACLRDVIAIAEQIGEDGLKAQIDHRSFRSQIGLTIDSVLAAYDGNSQSAAQAVRYAAYTAEEGRFLLQAKHINLSPPPDEHDLMVFSDLAHQHAKAAISA